MSEITNEKTVPKESILENPEAIVGKIGDFETFLERNTKLVSVLVAGVVIVVAGYFGYNWWTDTQNQEAQTQMFPAVYYFEQDSLKKALNGDGNNIGLISIAEDFGSTKAGELAKFYIGAIYLKQGKYQEAIDNLSGFSSNDILIGPRANCLMGDAYMELNDHAKALEYYKKAALHTPNKYFSPRYLMKAALAQELMKNYSDAVSSYNMVLEKYYDSQEAQDAKKAKARVEQLSAGN